MPRRSSSDPTWTLEHRERPFLVVRGAGSLGFDLVALRRELALPVEVKASAESSILFSAASGRAADQLEAHRTAVERVGLVAVYAYRKDRTPGRRPVAALLCRSPTPTRDARASRETPAAGRAHSRGERGASVGATGCRSSASWAPCTRSSSRLNWSRHDGARQCHRFHQVRRRPEPLTVLAAQRRGRGARHSRPESPSTSSWSATCLPAQSTVRRTSSRACANRIGLETAAGLRVEAASASGAAAFHAAVHAVTERSPRTSARRRRREDDGAPDRRGRGRPGPLPPPFRAVGGRDHACPGRSRKPAVRGTV